MEVNNNKTDSQETFNGIFKVLKKGLHQKKVWSEKEDKLLLEVISKFGNNPIKWKEVSDHLNKTSKQCYSRYRQINPSLNKGFWTEQEETELKKLVANYGKRWAYIAKIMKTRSGKQIRHHYLNILDANNKKAGFSQEEDEKIKELFLKHGPKWQIISKHFVGRTGDTIKSRYYNKIKTMIECEIYMNILNKNNKQKNDSTTVVSLSCEQKSETFAPTTYKPVIVQQDGNLVNSNDYISAILKHNNIKDENNTHKASNCFGLSTVETVYNENILFQDLNLNNGRTQSFNAVPFVNHDMFSQEMLFRDVIMRSINSIQIYQNIQLQQSIKSQSVNTYYTPFQTFQANCSDGAEDERKNNEKTPGLAESVTKSSDLLSYLNVYEPGKEGNEELSKYFEKDNKVSRETQVTNPSPIIFSQTYNINSSNPNSSFNPYSQLGQPFPRDNNAGISRLQGNQSNNINTNELSKKSSINHGVFKSSDKDTAFGFWKKDSLVSRRDRNSSSDNSSY